MLLIALNVFSRRNNTVSIFQCNKEVLTVFELSTRQEYKKEKLVLTGCQKWRLDSSAVASKMLRLRKTVDEFQIPNSDAQRSPNVIKRNI